MNPISLDRIWKNEHFIEVMLDVKGIDLNVWLCLRIMLIYMNEGFHNAVFSIFSLKELGNFPLT